MTKKRRVLVVLDRLRHLAGLPPSVAFFQARAVVSAARCGDAFALQAASQPSDVRALLGLAKGRRTVVELGTATGWTTASLALADPARTVASYDPVVQEGRERYAALVPRRARSRMTFMQTTGEAGAGQWDGPPVDLLFVDSTHTRDDTLAEFCAWRPHLDPNGVVVFHDFGNPAFPGVAEAVRELGLPGEVVGGSYAARPGQPTAIENP
jgi:predicted O-methyltransferase YrrM